MKTGLPLIFAAMPPAPMIAMPASLSMYEWLKLTWTSRPDESIKTSFELTSA
jgi:hypothetical protein